jgi:uncharacterized membrane protein
MIARLKNYGLWIAVSAFALLVAQTAGLNITPEKWNGLVDGFLGILVLAGIINNPTTIARGFFDDKK